MSHDTQGLNLVIRALEVIHDPSSPNTERSSAQNHLDQLHADRNASCFFGFELAKQSQDIVRHFGLNLLGGCITKDWVVFSLKEQIQIREWVIELCYNAVRAVNETNFILEKLAVLLVEIAKREWLQTWQDLDDVLQSLWNTNQSTRAICLKTLTNLIEDVFLNDDPVAGLRSPLLSAGLISIMASSAVVKEFYASNPLSLVHGVEIRPDSPGWLRRLSDELVHGKSDQALSILQVLRVTLSWIITKAIIDAGIMQRVCSSLTNANVPIRICAVDCLYIMLTRPLHPLDAFLPEIYTLYQSDSLQALSEVWRNTANSLRFSNATLNDDNSYTMLKKFSETIMALACLKFGAAEGAKLEDIDLANVLDLVLLTWQHNSLIISGMSNNFWCSLLRDERLNTHEHVISRLNHILQSGAQRLLHFEDARVQMLKGTEVQLYLDVDLESGPDLHAFCGNYRRFAFDIVRMVVFKRPLDATTWIRQQVMMFFCNEYVDDVGADFARKTSPMCLLADKNFTLAEACLRGVLRFKDRVNTATVVDANVEWSHTQKSGVLPPLTKTQHREMLSELEATEVLVVSWCEEIVALHILDPLVLGRQITLLVGFSVFLHAHSGLLFKILQRVIETATYFYPTDPTESTMSAIRDLRSRCGVELLRLGSTQSDQLWTVFPQLQQTVDNILSKESASESELMTFNSLLLAISQGAKATDEHVKKTEFNKILLKVVNVWNKAETTRVFESFESFAASLMIDRIGDYLSARQISTRPQLDGCILDAEGRELLRTIKKGRSWSWPIRATRKFVDVTLDTTPSMREFEKTLWKEPLAQIVPNILRILERVAGYYDEQNWAKFPPVLQLIARESVLERFWLQGVSQLTRDEFLEASARNSDSCYELVHVVGHFLRRTREYCLASLGTFSLLGASFYCLPNIADLIIKALFWDTNGSSLHVWSTMITSCIRHVILNCPREHYCSVLDHIMATFPRIMLDKLRLEWAKVMERGALQSKDEEVELQGGEENLSDEMMEESLLRHLSFNTMKLMNDVLTPTVTTLRPEKGMLGVGRSSISDWLLHREPLVGDFFMLLSFCLTVNDTRTSIYAAKILKQIIPAQMELEGMQNYICHEVFSATIRCVNDSYFVAIQAELSSLLASIYYHSLGKSTLPREILLSIPQLSGNVGLIRQFEEKLTNSKTERTRKSLMLELLANHGIVGREAYGRGSEQRVKLGADVTTKEVIRRFQESVSLQQDQEPQNNILVKDEESGIANLFK